jgi:hypothetical protein
MTDVDPLLVMTDSKQGREEPCDDAESRRRKELAFALLRQHKYSEARELMGDDFVDGWMQAEDAP